MKVDSTRELGAVVRARRKQLQFTQEALSNIVGVSRPWLSAFERGKPTAEVGRVLRVIDALALDLVIEPRFASDLEPSNDVDLDDVLHDYGSDRHGQ